MDPMDFNRSFLPVAVTGSGNGCTKYTFDITPPTDGI
ncbi:hypothetical protein PC121_g11093 [Phytophthora cactorum]|nr:hypothetical protein PC121_g11093 [Phytophthora cactorum]